METIVQFQGLREALQDLAKADNDLHDGMKRALWRMGGLVKKTAVQYAPISPSTGMLKKFLKRGAIVGDSIEVRSRKRGVSSATLTKFYATRLSSGYYGFNNPRSTNRPMPGGLMRSIAMRSDETKAEIFVPANSLAGKYAFRIHEEFGQTWFHRGPGTQAKGPQARDKYIERAINDNQNNLIEILRKEADRAIRTATGG